MKASNNFRITGSKLVTDVIQTETHLDLDQCAASCFKWRSPDSKSSSNECRSFNFCAKGQSNLCQLSRVTVHDANVQLTDSTTCINYEMISPKVDLEKSNNKPKVSELGGGSIVMLIVYIAIGLGFGTVSPFIYKKIKSRYMTNELPMERLS